MRRIAFYSPVFFALVVLLTAQTIEHEPEREHWQQPAAIFEAMAVAPGSIVADVGAGDGFLTLRLAPLVGANGHVYGEDIAQSRLDLLRVRAQEAHLDNITVVTGSPDDPHLPAAQLDAVVILNAYHEMPQHNEMLRRIHGALKPGGRLVIAEPSPAPGEATREQQTAKHHIASTFIAEDMDRAGFTIIETREKFAHIPDAGYYSLVVGAAVNNGCRRSVPPDHPCRTINTKPSFRSAPASVRTASPRSTARPAGPLQPNKCASLLISGSLRSSGPLAAFGNAQICT